MKNEGTDVFLLLKRCAAGKDDLVGQHQRVGEFAVALLFSA